jgi:hypothetical protein
MSSSKEIDLLRDFAAGVYLSEARNPILPLTHCLRVYNTEYCTYSHREERERVEPERSREATVHISWVENNNMTDCMFL